MSILTLAGVAPNLGAVRDNKDYYVCCNANSFNWHYFKHLCLSFVSITIIAAVIPVLYYHSWCSYPFEASLKVIYYSNILIWLKIVSLKLLLGNLILKLKLPSSSYYARLEFDNSCRIWVRHSRPWTNEACLHECSQSDLKTYMTPKHWLKIFPRHVGSFLKRWCLPS